MGRTNRSRKRRDEMNRIKRERYAKKELIRLKKTLGIIDQGDEIMKEVEEIAIIKSAKEIKNAKKNEDKLLRLELDEEHSKGEIVEVTNEKTGKVQKFNTKTMKDQNGKFPTWYKPRKTPKKIRKMDHARKLKFKQQWTTTNVPL
ncbi:protein LLP homolog [Condylostylus longicornis]|uniref:protein LLP homolog n=1 Tax=Condylostylus longicornis TaxID=2530218 RepID=UPI00244E147C|nr:protein LLP homolog [Condylostylus longicornis]